MAAEKSFIAYATQRFPALRTTFIRRELEALQELGLPIEVFSMRPANREEVEAEPEAAAHLRTTHYLPTWPIDLESIASNVGVSFWKPRMTFRNWALLAADPGAPGVKRRIRVGLQIWRGAVMAKRLQRLGQCVHVHAQFADGAATTALVCARLLDVPFSFTSHTSYDPPALKAKLREARFVASISDYDRERLIAVGGSEVGERINVIHCGIPIDDWKMRSEQPRQQPPKIISVGALNEKKGHDVLIDACAHLRDRGYRFNCEIIGGGDTETKLRNMIQELQLNEQVSLTGPLPQHAVRERLYSADLFVLACKETASGDTDGIPVSLMEAMAAGVPVVSTKVAGVPELLDAGRLGGLVDPESPQQLAEIIEQRLFQNPTTSENVADARHQIEKRFNQRSEARRLAELLNHAG